MLDFMLDHPILGTSFCVLVIILLGAGASCIYWNPGEKQYTGSEQKVKVTIPAGFAIDWP